MKFLITTLLFLCANAFAGKAQQTYCTTDLYYDMFVCKTQPQQNNVIQYHLGIRDFTLKGNGTSKIVDTATACASSNGGQFNQPGYSDRTSIAPVELRRDSAYTITIKQVEGYDSAGIVKRYRFLLTWVAIDFNNNFNFDTAAAAPEFVIVPDSPYISTYATHYIKDPYLFNGLQYPAQPYNFSFKIKIPTNAPYGIHRLRIRAVGSINPFIFDPCDKEFYGETQDYLVKIVPVPASVGSLATNADRFSLAPNPATATTTLQIPPGSAATEAQLMDIQGRLCATQKGAAGTTTLSFDTDALPAGLYFVKVTEQGQPPVVLKLVK